MNPQIKPWGSPTRIPACPPVRSIQQIVRRRSIGGPNVQHGALVGVDALPAANVVEQADGRRRRRQQHGIDLICLEKIEKPADVLELERTVIGHFERFAVELGTPVDEHRHLPPDHIAAEWQIVENPLGIAPLQGIDGSGG